MSAAKQEARRVTRFASKGRWLRLRPAPFFASAGAWGAAAKGACVGGCGGCAARKGDTSAFGWVVRSIGNLREPVTWENTSCSCMATRACPNQTQMYRWFGGMDGEEIGFGARSALVVSQWVPVEAFSGYGWLRAWMRGWLRVWLRCGCPCQPFRGFAGSRVWLRVSRGTVAEPVFD